MSRPISLLFLCTHNSARSILAEALLNALGKGRFIAYSAGSTPRDSGQPNPLAIRALAEAGIGRPALVVNPAGLGLALILVLHSEAALETGPVIEPVGAFVARLKRAKLIAMDQRVLNLTAP